MPDQRRGLFEHEAFEHVAVRVPEVNVKTTWLPYFERLVLVVWLFAFCLGLQALLEMPVSRLGRMVVASLWVWLVLLGMGQALRRSRHKIAVDYQSRVRRRRLTFVLATVGAVVWILMLYVAL